jgi:hypothetical protein
MVAIVWGVGCKGVRWGERVEKILGERVYLSSLEDIGVVF